MISDYLLGTEVCGRSGFKRETHFIYSFVLFIILQGNIRNISLKTIFLKGYWESRLEEAHLN